MSKFISLIGFLVLVSLISWVSSTVTVPAVQSWYQHINKPIWTPPDWVFAPVWTVLYTLIAISGWRVWQKLPSDKFSAKFKSLIMSPYWIQLMLNFSWSLLFFGMKQPTLAALNIIALLIAIILNIISFARVDRLAAWLLAPYFLWVAYATSLNIGILVLN